MNKKQQQAHYLLDSFFAKVSTWPSPTGLPAYNPHPTDIIISTYPKSGTTLLQNMAYQIASVCGGTPSDPAGTNFHDIEQVAPWLDYAPQMGVPETTCTPRIYKTHSAVNNFNLSRSKFIYCIRSPLHWPASWLDFLFDWISDENTSDPQVREEIFQEFVRRRLLGKRVADHGNGPMQFAEGKERELGPWFLHVKYWTMEARENLLVLVYEDVVKDLEGCVKTVARFMGKELGEEAVARVVQRCGREVMACDGRFGCRLFAKMVGLDAEKGGMKAVVERQCGFKGMRIEEESLREYERCMKEVFGVESYEELCEVLRERHGAWNGT